MPPRVLNAGSNATKSPNDSTTLCPGGLAAMRMGAVMMRLSNLPLTSPAVTGLIMVTVLVLGAIVVRVVTLSEHGVVPTHIARDQGTLDQGTSNQGRSNQGPLDRGSSDRATLDTGDRGIRGTLP